VNLSDNAHCTLQIADLNLTCTDSSSLSLIHSRPCVKSQTLFSILQRTGVVPKGPPYPRFPHPLDTGKFSDATELESGLIECGAMTELSSRSPHQEFAI
jgi:hypothetical protein